MSSSQMAENYQLKWHSHLTNLNSSVATLYRNEKFADVLLFTSHSDGGCGIPAHKIILSSCSHFFASIFETNPPPPNSMVYVVLPPELSKRSIQILIQYMYSGEATVSNDILNEVLHGGELLKIRGLWRNKTPTASSSESHPFNTPVESTASSGRDSSAYAGDKIIYETVNHERSTNNLSIVKESPVIVTSPTHISAPPAHKSNAPLAHHIAQGIDMPSQTTTSMPLTVQPQPDRPPPPSVQQQTAPSTHHLHRHHVSPHHSKQIVCNDLSTNLFSVSASSHLASIQASILSPPPAHEIAAQHPSNLIVKKELSANANDDRDLSATHYGLVPLQMTTNKMTSSDKRLTKTITENGNSLATNSNVLIRSPANLSISAAAAQYQQRIGRRYSEENFLYAKEPNDEPTRNANHHSLEHSACTDSEHSREKSRNHQLKASRHSMETTSVVENATHSESSASDAIRMMTIKQEPAEWAEFGDGDNHSEKANIEVNVKPELVYPKGDSDEEGEAQDPIYSPLTCELCSETFTIPADWVRHIESHSEPATHCVPKKRKRIEDTMVESTAALRCDLCAMYFVTPAEWVRHVQNMHTETELALSNNSQTMRRNSQPHSRPPRPIGSSSRLPPVESIERSCGVCKKMFPSYASMIVHKRSHTTTTTHDTLKSYRD